MQELRCSRCGCKITTPEYVKNIMILNLFGIGLVFPFCNRCRQFENAEV